MLLLTAALPGRALAANIVVNSLADNTTDGDGSCTLREAITATNNDADFRDCVGVGAYGADTITFSIAGTILLGSTLPDIADADGLTIDGGSLVAISGNDSVRVFVVTAGAVLALEKLLIQDGKDPSGGGGLRNVRGTVTITDSTLSGHSAVAGGGIFNDRGTVTITNSTLSGNSAIGGGALANSIGTVVISSSRLSRNSGSANGGGILSNGALTITDSTLSRNSSVNGGGILNNGALTITDSTLSDNSGDNFGGGINNAGTLTITNSTLSGNTAPDDGGGGIFNNTGGTATITNSTLSGNAGFEGGGILNNTGGTVAITNSIVGNSLSGLDCVTVGAFTANGSNLDTDGTCPGFTQVSPAQLNLGPLLDNGGPTQTHALLPGSVAIDTGDQSECTALDITRDQRGFLRDAHCDIGAFEFGAQLLADLLIGKSASLTSVRTGQPLTYIVTVQNNGPDGAEDVVITDPLPQGTTFVSVAPPFPTCIHPPVGAGGTVSCAVGDLAPGQSVVVTIEVEITARGGTTITNTATASSATSDPFPANNSASLTTRVFGSRR